ncbi:MAG: hypothetical protein HC866_10345 [Leptolyngbyaceae cyanobacterium RU_5_1]|nr:hypothetical protein [Leptolyngbyaceae cyanobacterium RU_5_1]
MSETVSFLGGAAIAGVAALLLLRGGIESERPNIPAPQPSPAPSVVMPAPASASVVASPSPASNSTDQQNEAQKNELNSLKLQADQQKLELEKLKYHIQLQQSQIQALNTQAKTNTVNVPTVDAAGNPIAPSPHQVATSRETTLNPILTGMLWATGGAVFCLMGGTLLLILFAAFSRQRPRSVQTRRAPYPIDSYERMFHRDRYALPLAETQPMRRVRQPDYDD